MIPKATEDTVTGILAGMLEKKGVQAEDFSGCFYSAWYS